MRRSRFNTIGAFVLLTFLCKLPICAQVPNDRLLTTIQAENRVRWLALSPDGKQIAAGLQDTNEVTIWNPKTAQQAGSFIPGGKVECATFSPDGSQLAGGLADGTVKVWEAQSGKELVSIIGHFSRVSGIAYSPDGQWLITGSQDGRVCVWNGNSGKQALGFVAHVGGVAAMVFSPVGRRIATAAGDGTVRLWEGKTGKLLLTIRPEGRPVNKLAFSADGTRLASTTLNSVFERAESVVRVRDVATGRQVVRLGRTGRVTALAFSPDSRYIALGTTLPGPDGYAEFKGTIKLYSAQSGREMLALQAHEYAPTAVLFAPDGDRIISGSEDKTIRIWNVRASVTPEDGADSTANPDPGAGGNEGPEVVFPNHDTPESGQELTMPLARAIQEDRVEAWITGTGASSGDSIRIQVRRLKPDRLKLTVAAGEVLMCSSAGVQNMTVSAVKGLSAGETSYYPTAQINLTDNGIQTYVLEAYCINFHNGNPGKTDSFTLSPVNPRAARLLIAGQEAHLSTTAMQCALWMALEGITPEEIRKKFPASDTDFGAAQDLIKNTVE